MENNGGVERFREIDSLRGIAIVLMIFFHAAYDLNYFRGTGSDLGTLFWFFFPRFIASAFILLAGVSLTLSFSAARRILSGRELFMKFLKRGLWIFSWGLCITVITRFFLPSGYVVFGILHFIGLSVILAYPFLRSRYTDLFLGALLISLGLFLQGMEFDSPYLLWLGLAPQRFYTIDYFPLIPWFGVFLVGIFFGNTFYPGHERKINVPDMSKNSAIGLFSFLGRHSLLIYLLHQPLLIGLMYASGII
jgi:uncharacterized membrane protein